MAWYCSDFRYYFHNESTKYQIWDILATDTNFWSCVTDEQFMPAIGVTNFLRLVIIQTLLFVMLGLKLIHGTHFISSYII